MLRSSNESGLLSLLHVGEAGFALWPPGLELSKGLKLVCLVYEGGGGEGMAKVCGVVFSVLWDLSMGWGKLLDLSSISYRIITHNNSLEMSTLFFSFTEYLSKG